MKQAFFWFILSLACNCTDHFAYFLVFGHWWKKLNAGKLGLFREPEAKREAHGICHVVVF